MSRLPLFLLAALVATPVLALEEGTYPVRGETASGEISVTDRWLSLTLNGENACQAVGEGRVLRGADGAWGAVFETGAEPCVLVGDETGFVPVGASCAALSARGCEMRGWIEAGAPETQVSASAPVQVIPSLLRGRFSRMEEGERRAVQSLLAERGFYDGGIDGAYGPGTEAALIAQLQSMADQGQEVDGNSTRFVRELMEGMAEEGAELIAQASPPPSVSGRNYVGTWRCRGETYVFSADRYRMINDYDGAVLYQGRLRPDLVDDEDAFLELIGYGYLSFFDVGTPDMLMHDPRIGDSWPCRRG